MVDNLILEASVIEDFEDTLAELGQMLTSIDQMANRVFPIDAEVRLGDSLAKLETLDSAVDSVDDDINIETGESRLATTDGGSNPFDDIAAKLAGAQANGLELLDRTGPFADNERQLAISNLVSEFADLELKMGDFFKVFASILPLLFTFIGALPAAIGGLIALGGAAVAAATALGSVGGLAVLGMAMDGGEIDLSTLQENLTELKESFLDAFGPVANRLAPLATEAFGSVETIFARLGDRAQFLTTLTDDARGALDYLERTVPSVLDKIVRFGAASFPVFAAVDAFLGNLNLIEGFGNVLADTLPLLFTLATAVAEIVPPLLSLSMGFLFVSTVVIKALTSILSFFDVIPYGLELLGVLIGTILTLATVSALYSVAGQILSATFVQQAATILSTYIPSLSSLIGAQVATTLSTLALKAALVALIGVLAFGLGAALYSVGSAFVGMESKISSATDSLREFGAVGSQIDGMDIGMSATAAASGQSRQSTRGYDSARDVTVIAPDQETGNAIANEITFKDDSGSQTSSTENRDSRYMNE
ncbi:hypothetical protein G9463_18405 [Haloarcula sp. JP-Z28]|uniref:hypothetical protein n=1 Tax=Haloarcula sp. JP-Z28 TaxID=2716715 RepID=UPI0014050CDD|nr:hypothetical protein [Haloarcula sp. JP-Z28]NHN65257.1 hypothetical protein [Haloarcula sp. JP-Z28]